MTLQGMLKSFALSQPKLDFDVVLLDEAQDSSPCALQIVQAQAAHSAILLVGDGYQVCSLSFRAFFI